jgi:aryl-alcohol dehydrogenase-like predicted oxidoreductase
MSSRISISRRAFLSRGLGLAALCSSGLWPGGGAFAREAARLPTRPLGRTGLEVSILGLGGVYLGHLPEAEGVAVVEAAVQEGVTFLDTASIYRSSEKWIGRALEGTDRSGIVIATKTLKRTRDGAAREIEESLKRLRIDRVDLFQIHSVNHRYTLRQILAPDGSLKAALEFKEAGHVSHIGITGHRRPEVLVEALKAYPFETALIPVNPAGANLYDFVSPMAEASAPRGVGLIAMKVLADGALSERCEACLRYALGKPVSCAIVGMDSVAQVRANVSVARAFRPMAPKEEADLEQEFLPLASTEVLWWKR